ncbi:MAG: transposase domain-containing protein [Verrucomicrobiota bacterium]
MVGSCMLQGIDPYAYLVDIAEKLPDWPSNRVHELTPKSWRASLEAAAIHHAIISEMVGGSAGRTRRRSVSTAHGYRFHHPVCPRGTGPFVRSLERDPQSPEWEV